ncbi:MAG: hypothetical protein QW100_02280, partial [Thermoplasmatales archaeon]
GSIARAEPNALHDEVRPKWAVEPVKLRPVKVLISPSAMEYNKLKKEKINCTINITMLNIW